MFLLVYIDDIVITSSLNACVDRIILQLRNEFSIKDLGNHTFFLGIHVLRTTEGLFLSQQQYIANLLGDENLANLKPASSPMKSKLDLTNKDTPVLRREKATRYRCILGSLQYLTTKRPYISYVVNKLAHFLSNPTELHWQALQRVLQYISENPFLGIMIHRTKSTTVEVFSNADWARDVFDRRSHGRFVMYYGGNVISWQSKKQAMVALNSLIEVEYKILADATSEALWVCKVLNELGM